MFVGKKPVGSNFENVVDHYIERGCQSDLPNDLADLVKQSEWTEITLNETNYGIAGKTQNYCLFKRKFNKLKVV